MWADASCSSALCSRSSELAADVSTGRVAGAASTLALRSSQEAESQRSAPTDTASSDGGSGALDAAVKGPRLSVNEYAAWMGTYPGMDFRLPSSQGACQLPSRLA